MSDDKDAEGTRAFGVFIAQVNDGELHSELSETTQKTMTELRDYAVTFSRDAKGTITLVLGFSVDEHGVTRVTSEVKTKLPKRPKASSTFWLTANNNLALENPRQQKLKLREVAPSEAARDLPSETKAVRNV